MGEARPFERMHLWGDPWFWGIFAVSALYDWLIFLTLGPLNSDEVHNGLAAFQILDGEWIVFAAQKHLGSVPAWLNAPFIWAFGSQDWVPRALNLVWRRLDVLLVYGAIRLLMGRKAALAGTFIFAFPPRILVGTLLLAINYGLTAFLWLVGIFFLCLSLRHPSRWRSCGLAIGLTSGLALWTTPLSVVVVAPLMCVFPLLAEPPSALAKRAAIAFGAGLAASLPWWHYNLWTTFLGSLRTDIAMIPPVSGYGGWLMAAFENWKYYAAQVVPSALAPSAPLFSGGLKAVFEVLQGILNVFALALPAIVIALLIRSGSLPSRSDRDGDKRAVFWWCVVLASIALWMAAVGLTYPGTIRGQVARYALPFLIWIPFMASRVALQPKRNWLLVLMSLFLVLPAFQDAANLPSFWQHRQHLDQHKKAVLQQIQDQGATYIAGDYWDVFAFTFWTERQTIGVALRPDLVPRQDLPFLDWRPQRGTGLLLIREGSEMARTVQQRPALDRLAAPQGFWLYRIPTGSGLANSISFQ